jgi:DNA-binding IclR family transcriptional regulator
MEQRPDWMSTTDVLILLALDSSEMIRVLTPTVIATNLGFSREHTSRRLGALSEHGYVKQLGDGKYRLSEAGRSFVTGYPDSE